MLNSGKKIGATKKINILTLVLFEKKNSERNKKPYPPPPPFKLNDRSLRPIKSNQIKIKSYGFFLEKYSDSQCC